MRKYFVFAIVSLAAVSCNHAKEHAKEAIKSTGEAVGKAGTEFSNGVGEGVKKALECEVVLSDELKAKGLKTGKVDFTSQKEATDNNLSLYMIYDKDFNGTIKVKAFDEKGLEYGRSSVVVKGKKGEAGYIDFTFDKRVNLEAKSKFILE